MKIPIHYGAAAVAALLSSVAAHGQVVQSTGDRTVQSQRHDAGLRPVVGVHEYALFRPTKSTASNAGPLEGHAVYDTTFNHHPFLTYWNGRFYSAFIGYDGSSSHSATENSKRLRLQWSSDGRNWSNSNAADIFPTPLATHQRCAFYIADNGKLLVTTWYSPRGESNRGEIGSRLVREIKGPNNFGPIYTLKQNKLGASGAGYAMFTSSSDSGFKSAAQELFDNKLEQQSRWEEDRDTDYAEIYDKDADPTYKQNDHEAKAFQWYRTSNGRIVSFWKGGYSGVTSGSQWKRSDIKMDLDLDRFGHHRNSKTWGEPLTTGRYAMLMNRSTSIPNPIYGHKRAWSDIRTPLTVTTSGNGFLYDTDYLTVSGDCGPQLFRNAAPTDNKAVGASYTRGLTFVANRESDKTRPNDNMWVTYSTNKEYIWVTEIPKEMSSTVSSHVNDDLTSMNPGGRVGQWNIRDSAWGSVRLVSDGGGAVLRLADKDRYDYARAVRVFPESNKVTVSTRVRPQQSNTGELQIELMDKTGKRPVRLRFASNGDLQRYGNSSWAKVADYNSNSWYALDISCDAVANSWTLTINGVQQSGSFPFSENVNTVERVEFRTGNWRMDDFSTQWYGPGTPGDRTSALSNASDPVSLAAFDISMLKTEAGANTPPPAPTVATTISNTGLVSFGNDDGSYDSQQDGQGGKSTSVTVSSDKSSAKIEGNAWKRFPISYNVKSDTVLTFDINGSNIGEITGIALDNDATPLNAKRAYLLGGSQVGNGAHSSWAWTLSSGYAANSGTKTISIPVGKDFQGQVNYLGLIGDDDGGANTNVTFSNVRLSESSVGAPPPVDTPPDDTPPTGPGGSTAIASNGNISLGNDTTGALEQDGQKGSSTSIAISSDGRSATLAGNAWKVSPLSYSVTANTILEFTVNSSDTGEILGISLDTDKDPLNNRRAFLIGGSDVRANDSRFDSWSWVKAPLYQANSGALTYSIPVGQDFQGSVSYIGLIADDDNTARANATFSNIRLYEGSSSGGGGDGGDIAPSADSYVRGGSNASTNYGSDSKLRVKGSSNETYDRISYLKFDLSAMSGSASSVNLKLPVEDTQSGGTFTATLKQVSSDSWSESGINWNNKPSTGNTIQTFEVKGSYAGSDIIIDVTSYVNSQRSGDGVASFALTQVASENGIIDFASRESSTPPMLEIDGGSTPIGNPPSDPDPVDPDPAASDPATPPSPLTIQAENVSASQGITIISGSHISAISKGDWAKYSGVDFSKGYTKFTANVAVPSADRRKTIQIRLDSTTGPIIGTYTMESTGGWSNYTLQSTNLSSASGVRDVYLVVSSEASSSSGAMDWIRFE